MCMPVETAKQLLKHYFTKKQRDHGYKLNCMPHYNVLTRLTKQGDTNYDKLIYIYKAEKLSVRPSVRHADNSPGSAYSDLSTA